MQAFVVLVFLAPEAADAAARKDMARLDGAWTVVAAEAQGKRVERPPVERVVFAAGKAGEAAGQAKGAGAFTYRLDPGKSPKVIEATAAGTGAKGKGLVGIYELGDGTLKLCLVPGGSKPPGGFTTEPDDGALLLELKREKK
jgi:uncharacterized protein (TIGR03067 family)